MFRKLYSPVALLMLIVILITLLAHSSHLTHTQLDDSSVTKSHDCALCQQGIDSATKKVSLAFLVRGVFSAFKAKFFSVSVVLPAYTLPLLRAPPYPLFV